MKANVLRKLIRETLIEISCHEIECKNCKLICEEDNRCDILNFDVVEIEIFVTEMMKRIQKKYAKSKKIKR